MCGAITKLQIMTTTELRPDDWPQRRRAKALVRLCEEYNLKDAVHQHSISLFGRDVWSLSGQELDLLERTFASIAGVLDCQLDQRSIN